MEEIALVVKIGEGTLEVFGSKILSLCHLSWVEKYEYYSLARICDFFNSIGFGHFQPKRI
jgi:hypothetical protein